MVVDVIGGYREGQDAEYKRYLGLEGILSGSLGSGMERVGFDTGEDSDKVREERKQESLRGDSGVSAGVSRMFRDMLEDYLPGGYFRWHEYAGKMADNFYKMAYVRFRDLLPKLISMKLKDFNIDRSEGSVEIDSEVLNKVIMDSVVYLHEHPEVLKDGLVRAYRRKEGEESRGVGMAEAFFVPRVDKSALAERSEVDSEVREGDADDEVLSNLKDRGEIKWKWRGIDEYGVLHFTLPELYGSREFTVKMPSDIQYIKPGEYTFRVKDVKEGRGAVLEFKEQHEQITGHELEGVEESGLGEDQLRSFINNGVLNKYITYLRSLPGEKLVEDFLGAFSIGGEQIGSVSDLEELGGYGGEVTPSKSTRGKEKAVGQYEEAVGQSREKLQRMVDRWMGSPEIARHFMKVTEDDGMRIAKVVASQFPEVSEKGVPSLDSIFGTRPVVEMVLRYIMSPHVPMSSGKSAPWVHFAWDAFQKMALKDPSVRTGMEQMIRHKRKDETSGIPVTDDEISGILGGFGESTKRSSFMRLTDKLKKAIEGSSEVPELKKFFERRKVFKEYSDRVLADMVYEYMEGEGLSMDRPEDVEKVEKFMRGKITDLVGVMEGKRPLQSLYRVPVPKGSKVVKEAMTEMLIRRMMVRMAAE
jgi:hypothetical protein